MKNNYDFAGWATKNNYRCSDGRIILKDAFKDNDGTEVPLVWNHDHKTPDNILGHALLQNRDEGVYAYCTLNDTESGQIAKSLVQHGDITSLSIYANHLKQNGPNVIHGAIREVSLVLAGANPGALIDSVMVHGEEMEDEAIIYSGEDFSLTHADSDKDANENETVQDVFDTLTDKQKNVVYAIIGNLLEDQEDSDDMSHADESNEDETVEDVFNTLTDKQKNVVYAIIGQLMEDNGISNDEGEDSNMKHNLFDSESREEQQDTLTHSEMMEIISDGKRYGSLKESALAHGIEEIDYLFPDFKNVTDTPGFIKRDDTWVSKVMNSVHRTPFSRIRSLFADITADEARAKGYIKGRQKKDEVFTLLRRTTTPQTIYKKQKLDRDDVIDITDFDVVAWLKTEMRMMLNEEIARAVLVGDGRLSSAEDKINEANIRPIWTDDDLYTIHSEVNVKTSDDASAKASEFIDQVVRAMEDYDGSGNPTLFIAKDILTACLLLKDENGRRIYKDATELATAMMVKEIVPVPVMKGLTRTDTSSNTYTLMGIVVNLVDYNIGADKGGSVNMFDDFDIDYNAQKYLIETRCSGALIKPKSAIALEIKTAAVGG